MPLTAANQAPNFLGLTTCVVVIHGLLGSWMTSQLTCKIMISLITFIDISKLV